MHVGKVEREKMNAVNYLRAFVTYSRIRDKLSPCLPLIHCIIVSTYNCVSTTL
jgi:hypothetical protein